MGKFLDAAGLTYLWGKITTLVSGVDTKVDAVKDYTINSKKISTNPVLAKGDVGLANVTNDAQVKRSEMGKASGVATLGTDGKLPAAQLPTLKTVNGTSIVGSGNINIDLTLYKVVTELPTTNVDTTKIYLLASGTTGEQNIYTEYMYVNSKWEKIGEYTSSVDLTPYVKFTDVATTSKAGAMSAADKVKLDGLQNYTLPTASATAKGGVQLGYTANGKNYPVAVDANGKAYVNVPWTDTNTTYNVASASANGLMSKDHFTKLSGIAAGATADAALTEAEIDAACV